MTIFSMTYCSSSSSQGICEDYIDLIQSRAQESYSGYYCMWNLIQQYDDNGDDHAVRQQQRTLIILITTSIILRFHFVLCKKMLCVHLPTNQMFYSFEQKYKATGVGTKCKFLQCKRTDGCPYITGTFS